MTFVVDIGVEYLAPYESCGEDFTPVRPEHSEKTSIDNVGASKKGLGKLCVVYEGKLICLLPRVSLMFAVGG